MSNAHSPPHKLDDGPQPVPKPRYSPRVKTIKTEESAQQAVLALGAPAAAGATSGAGAAAAAATGAVPNAAAPGANAGLHARTTRFIRVLARYALLMASKEGDRAHDDWGDDDDNDLPAALGFAEAVERNLQGLEPLPADQMEITPPHLK